MYAKVLLTTAGIHWRTTYNYDSAVVVTTWIHPAGFTITQTITARGRSAKSPAVGATRRSAGSGREYELTPWGG